MTAPLVPAVTICALMLIGIIAALAWVSSRLAPHEPPYTPRHDRDRPFADPRDDTDPDGTQFVEAIKPKITISESADASQALTALAQVSRLLGELAPAPPALARELPKRQRKAVYAPSAGPPPPAGTLAAVIEGLRNLPDRPPVIASAPEFHPAPGCAEPDPDPADTGAIPAAVGTWGKTAAQLADELAAEHLGVRR